jgi:hypothetical protein
MDSYRKNDVLRVIVEELRKLNGTPVDVAVLAVKIDYQFSPRLDRAEIEAGLNYASALGCAEMTPGGRNQPLWAITPKGKIAEL